MTRWMIWLASGLALAVASGCVAARVREVPHVERTELAQRDGGLVVTDHQVRGTTLTATVQRATVTTYAEVRTVERIAEYQYLSAAYSVWDSVEHPAAQVAVLPLAAVGGVIDVAAWIVSAPFAYSAGAISAIDPEPTTGEVDERTLAPCAEGTALTVTAAGGLTLELKSVPCDAQGRITIDLDALATAALSGGDAGAVLEVRGGSGAPGRVGLSLAQLCDVAAVRIDRDRELRAYRWRVLRDQCPPEATAVRAALQARMDARP